MTSFKQRAVSLVENGYAIIPIEAGQKRPGFKKWQQYEASVDRVNSEWPKQGNIGILTARTPAVDIDSLDEQMARDMERFVIDLLGEAPTRVGRAPKRMLVFRTNEPFRKRDSGFFADAQGVEHKLEVLGDGQQFVGYGIHPDTGKPYRWVTLEALHDLPADDLPLIDAASADAIVAEFVRLATERGWKKASEATTHHEHDEFWFLRPKPDVSDDEVAEAVRAFPNPGRDYDLWVKVGAALHDHFRGSHEGLALWEEWAAQSPLYNETLTQSKWSSFGRYTGQPVTVGFLLAATRDTRKAKERETKDAPSRDARALIRDAIAAATSGDALLDEVLPMIAEATLDPASEQTLIAEVGAAHKKIAGTKPTSWALSRRVKDLRAESREGSSPADDFKLELRLARCVLDDHYAGGKHLKLFSKMWWEYRRGVWVRTEEGMVKSRIMATLVDLVEMQDEALISLASKMLESRGDRLSALTNSILSTVENLCSEEGTDDPLNLSATRVPMVLNAANGELWFDDDGNITPKRHNASHLLISQIGCDYAPKAECPTWDAAVRKVFKSCLEPEDVIRHFEEVFGYIIQATRHQALWVMLKGPGGNGKSFLLAVVSAIMGQQTVAGASINEIAAGVSSHFTDSLQGKLMLLDDDLKAGTLLPDDWLKKLSEAKLISANPKFGRAYNFTARSVPVILTNHWPSTTDLSEGLRRRAMIFESAHILTDEEKDPRDFARIIDHELPGVLNRLIAGFQRFLRRGQRFDIPWECQKSLGTWLASSNPTSLFASTILEQTADRGANIGASKVYDAYLNWVRFYEHNVRPLGRNKFYEALRGMGYTTRNHGGVWVVSGVRLRECEATADMFG